MIFDERGLRSARRDRRPPLIAHKPDWDDILELPRFMESLRCQNLARRIADEHSLRMDLMEFDLPMGCVQECHLCVKIVETIFGICPEGGGVLVCGDPGPVVWGSKTHTVWLCTSRMLYGKQGDVCPVGC